MDSPPSNPIQSVRWILAIAVVAIALQACSTPQRLNAVPETLTTKALPLGIPDARYYADEQYAEMFQESLRALERESEARGATNGAWPPAYFLAISGGGDDGAFGAGLLVGWSDTGTRPEFKVVTGVSAGALIAPFAFLGSGYDSKLQKLYTSISVKDVYEERGVLAAFFDDALSDTSPLLSVISKVVDRDMLDDIAREYDKGRLLLIGTTDLDARRPVIWNIGAIAKSKDPRAITLVHKLLLASAAVPAMFPPVMIDVEVEGHHYQEMHVDGGAIAQLFLYPPAVGEMMKGSESGKRSERERHAYIIRNGRLGKDWASVERQTLSIAGRAISTMIYVSGINDLFRTYFITQRDGVDYNLTYIESDFSVHHPNADFDTRYMDALFAYGRENGRNGINWKKSPPYLSAGVR
ncbi:MAG: patatin-like phospholipase family protein [Alphaproteobacteria bacterium]